MKRILNQSHSKETLFYSLSVMFERAAFYGFRSILVLYMVQKIGNTESVKIYGWFAGSIIFSQIIGALLGDLIIGNKKSIIIGGVIQTLGLVSLCIPSVSGLYIALFLVVIGNGLYKPNLISNFGKSYLNKTSLLDSGFTLFYFAVNVGAVLGVFLVGVSGEKFGWVVGFIIAGLLMLFSVISVVINKEKKPEEMKTYKLSINKRVLNILVAFIFVGLFWGVSQIANYRFFEVQQVLSKIFTSFIPEVMWSSLSTISVIIVSLFAVIIWSFFYSSQFSKLMVGFITGTISLGILLLIPKVPTEQHTVIYLLSILLLSISEIHIAPIIHSVLTKYSNPKYLAILISLSFIPTKLFSLFFNLFNQKFTENPFSALNLGIVIMLAGSILLFLFLLWKKKNYNKEPHKN